MPKTKTINLRIDEDALAKIDARAEKAGQSRSQYMVEASLREPRQPDQTHALDAKNYIMASLPVVPASQLPVKEGDHPGQTIHRCPRCNAVTIPWGPGARRCRTCATNFPAG